MHLTPIASTSLVSTSTLRRAGPEFRLVDDDGLSYRIDRAWGIYAALSRWGENKLRYFKQPVNGDLAVQVDAPLPPLQARAATLCTGLAPP